MFLVQKSFGKEEEERTINRRCGKIRMGEFNIMKTKEHHLLNSADKELIIALCDQLTAIRDDFESCEHRETMLELFIILQNTLNEVAKGFGVTFDKLGQTKDD